MAEASLLYREYDKSFAIICEKAAKRAMNYAEKETIYQTIKDSFLKQADTLLENINKDGYNISIGSEYVWGSNASVANNAMHLILANTIKANPEYADAAANHMHYCFGANPMFMSYVTGYGAVSPANVHHRPSYALK